MADEPSGRSVRRSLRVLIASEVFGVEVFSRAERHARTPADRDLYAALHALEQQTRAAVFERLAEEVHRFRAGERTAHAMGVAGGTAMPALPRPLQLRSVFTGAMPFVPHFRRLDAHFAGTPDAAFYGYVLAHEHAIIAAGKDALAGTGDPTAPIEALLGAVPT